MSKSEDPDEVGPFIIQVRYQNTGVPARISYLHIADFDNYIVKLSNRHLATRFRTRREAAHGTCYVQELPEGPDYYIHVLKE